MPLFTRDAFNDDFEEKLVPEGEYNLRIKSAEDKTSKSGNEMVTCIIENDDEPDAMAIFAHIVVPPEGHEYARLMMKNNVRFYKVFGLDPDCETEDMIGATALTGVKIGQNEQGEDVNELSLPPVRG